MRGKEYKIASLSEYIKLIKNENLESSYYRGENREYKEISSSLVRNFSSTNSTGGLINIYKNLLFEYYQEVGNELDLLQRENFLAFAQHHGLKTNLIDFTTAPLVALYFACEGISDEIKSGYIYLIKKDSTVDATDFLKQYSILTRDFINIYGELAKQNYKVIDGYKLVLDRYQGLSSEKNPFELVKYLSIMLQKLPQLERCHEYITKRAALYAQGIDGICKLTYLIQKYFPEFNIGGNNGSNEFIGLLMLYFDDIVNAAPLMSLPSSLPFPKAPHLIFRTPLKFDRIRNQCGVFLYQGFWDYLTDPDTTGGIMIQEILPDSTIEVTNQQAIIQELDLVGINKRFIYGDFDNTAQYINQKYYR